MEGRSRFTKTEAEQIRSLLRQKQTADRDTQKQLRGQLRKLGFFISDFSDDFSGFTAVDFDVLVARRAVTIDS
jgi:hypothetical protein